jgi:hypothetical protein
LINSVPALRTESVASTTTEVRGVGGTQKFNALTMPNLQIMLGGFETVLQPAHVLLDQVGPVYCVGNFGLDLLRQADSFQVDFDRMRLTLRDGR